MLSSGTQSGWESHVSRYEKKMKDKLDDEIKFAGLESLVPEELEKHLILNSIRLRTFEDARLEIVTYVEGKFGLRNSDSKPSDTGARGHSDPMDVDAVNSLSSGKGKGSSSPCDGCFKCGGAHFNETAVHARAQASNRMAKANRASHGPRVSPQTQVKVRARKTIENPKENPKGPKVRSKVPKVYTRAKHRKLVCQVLKTRNRRQAQRFWNLHRHYDTSASSLSLGGLNVSATSSLKGFEWVKMNLDPGAAVNTFPLHFGPEGAGDGIFYRTASGEWIPDGGAWQFQGYD